MVTLLLSASLLNACGEKQEEPAAPAESASAPAPAAPEPVKEEPGGWVPPPATPAAAPGSEPAK
ncbi:MAG TPA: hypothetical protein PLH03_04480 [Methylophilaceae bacterium]|nr:hypothetical protein [Methylophilaceae bacterium]